MEDELSRSSLNDEDDYDDTLENDNGEDYEATIEEDEQFESGDYSDELKDLEDENEMSIEELKKKYGYPPEVAEAGAEIDDEEDDDEDYEDEEGTSDAIAVGDQTILDTGNSLDDDDEEYIPHDPYKKEIRVDEQKYQAQIPEILSDQEKAKSTGSDVRNDAILLWSNMKNLPDEKLNEYLENVVDLRLAYEQSPPLDARKSRDDEDALCVLLRHDFDVESAKNAFPFPRVNYAFRTVRPDALSFDEKESKMFEDAIEKYGKDFSLIRRLVLPYRTVGELVEYYYQWKLTPFYRTWRDAHPAHAPVIQPHISSTFVAAHHESTLNVQKTN